MWFENVHNSLKFCYKIVVFKSHDTQDHNLGSMLCMEAVLDISNLTELAMYLSINSLTNCICCIRKPNRAKARQEKKFLKRKIIILEKRNFAFKRNILRFSHFKIFDFLKCEKRKCNILRFSHFNFFYFLKCEKRKCNFCVSHTLNFFIF